LRSDLKLARISSEKSCGCSQAAKWPPRSTWLQWMRPVGIRALGPAPRDLVELVGEDADGKRDRDGLGVEEARLVLPV